MGARIVRFLVPEWIDDPRRASGGNIYDREVMAGLRARGWTVLQLGAAGPVAVSAALAKVPDDALLLVDGLVAGNAAAEVKAASRRIRIVLLAHMVAAVFPDVSIEAARSERLALGCARRVIVTSRWTADELVRRMLVDRDVVTIAVPGARPTVPAAPPSNPGELICVGVIAPHKGQDLLLDALARVPRADWTCALAGSATLFQDFACRVTERAAEFGGRVTMHGTLTPDDLDAAYRRSALLVAPSRVESSGMAILEALARGIPVLGAAVGGIPQTVASGGALLVAPGDAGALAGMLESWMTDAGLRARLRREAGRAGSKLPTWSETASAIDSALVAA